MRVVVPPSIPPPIEWIHETARRAAEGQWCMINGEMCEPIECFQGKDTERSQRLARERAQREHARTGCVHKVVMSADF